MKKGTLMLMVVGVATAALIALAGCGGNQNASNDQKPSGQTQQPAATAPAQQPQQQPQSQPQQQPQTQQQQQTQQQPQTQQQTQPQQQQQTQPAPAQAQDNYIGEQAAKEIALADAGVAEADVYGLELKLDTDDAVVHYDVDFKANGMEYDYDIDPVTGAILKGTAEVDD